MTRYQEIFFDLKEIKNNLQASILTLLERGDSLGSLASKSEKLIHSSVTLMRQQRTKIYEYWIIVYCFFLNFYSRVYNFVYQLYSDYWIGKSLLLLNTP
jgi:hypothetical protein